MANEVVLVLVDKLVFVIFPPKELFIFPTFFRRVCSSERSVPPADKSAKILRRGGAGFLIERPAQLFVGQCYLVGEEVGADAQQGRRVALFGRLDI